MPKPQQTEIYKFTTTIRTVTHFGSVLFFLFCFIGSSWAATLTVNSPTDNSVANDGVVTLREAVTAANGDSITDLGERGERDDTIVFDASISTVTLTQGEIRITSNLTILGAGIERTIVDGNGGEIFHITNDAVVHVEGMTIKNGVARGGNGESRGTGGGGGAGMGGAIYIGQGRATCLRVNFESNQAIGGNGGGTQGISEGGRGGHSSHGLSTGGAGGNSGRSAGGQGGFGSGGGGGAGEWAFHNNADHGGTGGYGGGGGGGGGGSVTRGDAGLGGTLAGNGGNGNLGWSNGGGGGGSGLGGAIFVASTSSLSLDQCFFKNNAASGGGAGPYAQPGQGKGGAIFALEGASVSMYLTSFENNHAPNSSTAPQNPSGLFSDTNDLYGTATIVQPTPTPTPTSTPTFTPTPTMTPTATPTATPTPQPQFETVVVTTLADEYDEVALGQGASLREAIRETLPGGTITFAESILPGAITIDPLLGSFVIKKDLTIVGPGKEKLTIDGNGQTRVFFVGDANVEIRNVIIQNGYGRGGDGACSGGGGAAGMGGGLFLNRGRLTLDTVDFIHCVAQGGNGGKSSSVNGGGGGGFGGNASGMYGGSGGAMEGSGGTPFNYNGGDGGGGYGGYYDRFESNDINPGSGGFGGGGGGGGNQGGNGGYGGGSGAGAQGVGFPGAFGSSGYYTGGFFGYRTFRGGGGAGLGGAIFVRDLSLLDMRNCRFLNNQTHGGITPDSGAIAGRKGAALFALENSQVYGRQLTFENNLCNGGGLSNGFQYFQHNDTNDVYGTVIPGAPSVVSISHESPHVLDASTRPPAFYLVDFNIDVNGVDASDFIFTKSDALNDVRVESIEQITPKQYRVQVGYGDGFGQFTLKLVDDDTIVSSVTKAPITDPLENADGSYTGGTYQIFPASIHIQAVAPLQGVSAIYGQKAKEGFDLAVGDYNARGGYNGSQFEILYQDSLSTEEGARQAASNALADPGAFGVLSVLSSNTTAIAKDVTQKNLSLFSPATTIQLRGYPQHLAKTCPLDDYQVSAMATYLQNNFAQTIAVLADNSNYGNNILTLFQQTSAIEVAQSYQYATGQLKNDANVLQTALETLSEAGDNLSFGVIAGYAGDANAFLTAVQKHPTLRYVRWLVSDGCVFEEALEGIPAGYQTNNLLGFTPATVGFLTDDRSNDFQYKTTYNKKPSWDVYYNYDTALTLIHALERRPIAEPAMLWEAIPGLKFTGVTGPKEFDKEGELVSAVYSIYKPINGQWTVVGQNRIDQPPPGVGAHSSAKVSRREASSESDPRSCGFKQWLPGNDPGVGHFAGSPGDGQTWLARSNDLDEGWSLIAYYEDGRRDVNNYGKPFVFADERPYHLSFDMDRRNLNGTEGNGPILEVEVTAVCRYLDEDGREDFSSNVICTQSIDFDDWPNEELTRLDIQFVYQAPEHPAAATLSADDYLLKWELRLFNAAKQEVELRKVWTWAEPLEEDLPPFDSSINDWNLH